mgnify:CR=1 FL=1
MNNEKDFSYYIDAVREIVKTKEIEKGSPLSVYVQTFGCQQNEADSEHLSGMALKMGYEYTDYIDSADLVVFNTCAVREHAELKALSKTGQLKHRKAKNPDMVICICGCMVAQEHRLSDIKNRYPYVDLLLGATSPQKFPEYLYNVLKSRQRAFYPDTDAVIEEGLPVLRESSFKAWVSIMYGCNNFCTYCVVPYVRGRERSRKREDILNEIKELVNDGYKEITLLGQNVNSYGHDLYGDYDFADLLSDICKIKGDYFIRFMTSHPKDASKKLIDVIAENSKEDSMPHIAKHFHLPLQAGNDRVLKAMNRRYTSAQYLELVEYMKEKIPDITLSTDIIVGFPTETDEEFDDTIEMLEKIRYDALFSFIYSIRKGTPAANMEQVPDDVKASRFKRLLDTQNRISLEKNQAYVGKTEKVLVEGRSKTDSEMFTGRNEHNRLVHFKADDSMTGSFRLIKITSADTYSLTGTLEEG